VFVLLDGQLKTSENKSNLIDNTQLFTEVTVTVHHSDTYK